MCKRMINHGIAIIGIAILIFLSVASGASTPPSAPKTIEVVYTEIPFSELAQKVKQDNYLKQDNYSKGQGFMVVALFSDVEKLKSMFTLVLHTDDTDAGIEKARSVKPYQVERYDAQTWERFDKNKLYKFYIGVYYHSFIRRDCLFIDKIEEIHRGYIEVASDVAGTVLLNGEDTTYTVASGTSITLTIENANGEYEITVQDSSGKVWQANKTISLTGGSREIVLVEDPNYVTSANDLTYIQNTSGGLTITDYKGNYRKLVIPETISGIRVTEIGQSEVYGRRIIGTGVLSFGSSLESLVIPNSVTSIDAGAFMNCGLSSLILGNRVIDIGNYAFDNNRLERITLPASLKTIGQGAFANNRLTTVNIPNSVNNNNIGMDVFRDNPITTITLPANIGTSCIRFDENFVNFYISQNRRAGTYTKEDGIWKLTTPR